MFEGFAQTPGARLWYWDTGGTGEPLVLCHPASQSCQIWAHQRAAFAAAGLRVVAYSRRGHFKSEPGADGDAGTTVGDLADFLDWLGLDRVHLLGCAAGGITAAAFAVAHPGRVRSLVLAGTILSPDEEDWRELYGRLGIDQVRAYVPTEFLELGPAYRATNAEGVRRFGELEALAHAGKRFRQPVGVRMTWADLATLDQPVLLVTGEADLFAPPPLQEMVAKHLRHHQLATMAMIGHAPYWEDPRQFNDIVLRFINGLRDRHKAGH